jgi:2,4-dienoyl-CoA reductase-like NADH-dependent reductase (Old Yellow Enzyme family)
MPDPSPLFSPLKLRNLTFRNRVGVSPMCQYSAEDGFISDWHLVHLGSRAVGGAGLVMMEATGVTPEGRISHGCTGIWKDAHMDPLCRMTEFIRTHGAAAAIQLAHAGRKASVDVPAKGGKRLLENNGGWQTAAPSPVPFQPDHPLPHALTKAEIERLVESFARAAERAVKAGFQVIEIHGAHGYLLHEFLSPLSNKRTDDYGGTPENRRRFILEVAKAIRQAVPQDIVLGARLSCVDWAAGGITIADTVATSQELKKCGLDFIDCSSGFVVPEEKVPFAPGFQVPFAKEIRERAGIATCAVGVITEAKQADNIIRAGAADMVFLARALLRDPYWPVHAARELGQKADIPPPYSRGY